MSNSTRKVTPTRLLEAKDEEEFWRRKAAAASLRSEALSLDPTLGEPTVGRAQGRNANLAEQYESHYAEGLKISAFQKGLGTHDGQKPQPKLSPKEVLDRKAGIIEALVRAGKSSTEITEYLEKLGPFLDTASLATDPLAASILYSKVMGGGTQGLGMKDVIDTISMVDRAQGPQQQTDPASMISAVARVFEVAQQRHPEKDPVETFNTAVQTITPFLDKANESTKLAYQAQVDMLKMQLEQNRGADPLTVLKQWHETGQQLGLIGQPESDEIKLHRLHSLEADRVRAFELEKERWQHELRTKDEDRKQKAQNSMMQQVVGSIEKIVESPVIKELGKNVGGKIGVVQNPLAQAKSAAAQNQLSDPLSTPYSFTCGKCRKDYTFSAGQLTKISEAGGNWMCPSEGCHEVYRLKDHDKKSSGSGPGF